MPFLRDLGNTDADGIGPSVLYAASDPGAIGAGKLWSNGSEVKVRDQANTGWTDVGGGGGGTPSWLADHPDVPPAVADDADDEFDTGSGLDTAGTRFSGATPWVWNNQGSATASVADHRITLSIPAGTGSNNYISIHQAIGAGATWKYRAKMSLVCNVAPDNYVFAGLSLYNSANQNSEQLVFGYENGVIVAATRFDSPTVFVSNIVAPSNELGRMLGGWANVYMEVEYNGTNLLYSVLVGGYAPSLILSSTIGAHLSAVTHIGLTINNTNPGKTYKLIADWFRRLA
jgi:hypothetical protein